MKRQDKVVPQVQIWIVKAELWIRKIFIWEWLQT